jgi:small-conductance mechanosensitive channel
VPNEKLAAAVIRNYHLPEKDVFTLSIDVPISQDNDLDRAEEGALDVARDVLKDFDGKNGDPTPFVRFSAMGNGNINLSTFLQARDYLDGSLARHEFIKRLHRRFAELGVKLPSP